MLGVESQELRKENRYYLRYHNSISHAIELNQQIFGNSVGKDGKQPRFEHSIRVAGQTEEIIDQTMDEYHQCWLVGILHDNKEQNPVLFSEKIDQVLKDLFPKQQQDIKRWIDMLTSDKTLNKGLQKKAQITRVDKMDLVPSWIILFDKYDNCRRFKINGVGKSQDELNGYYAVAYLIYLKAKRKHKQIKEFIPTEIKAFYEKMGADLGGDIMAQIIADSYCKMY